MIPCQDSDQGVTFLIKVLPRSSRTELVGVHGDAVKIRVQAPPVEGRANEELVKLLARRLGVKTSCVSIVSGLSSALKTVRVSGLDAVALQRRLSETDERREA
ncbi:MAG: DUF167 domain-containing protein [Syntrophales bacterium]|nr:DUF167 domain-containing protein [Syntrophales bacterium]